MGIGHGPSRSRRVTLRNPSTGFELPLSSVFFASREPSTALVKVDIKFVISPIPPADEAKGKKRARIDDQSPGASPSKKVKGATVAKKPGRVPKLKLPRPPKVNAAAKAALKEKNKEARVTQPKWQTLIPLPTPQKERDETIFTEFKPRLWTSDREELLAILPEMCGPKCVNGVSWLLYQNPMIMLDGSTYFFETTKVDDLTIDLTTMRYFTCPAALKMVPDFDESLFGMRPLQNSLEDAAMDTIESEPNIVGHTSGGSCGMDACVVNGHWNATFTINPHTTGVIPAIVKDAQPCVGVDASQAVQAVAMDQERTEPNPTTLPADSATYCRATTGLPQNWEAVLEKLVISILQEEKDWAWIDNLPPEQSDKLIYILASVVGISPLPDESDLVDYPGHLPLYLLDLFQKRRGKMKANDPGIDEAAFNLTDNSSVGNYHTLDFADYCEQDPRPFGDSLIQGSDSDSYPSLHDVLLLPVPSPIPQEIQALIEAYIFGKPLTVIVSNERLYEHWALHLPREYGYVMMGFYRIIGVEEYRVQSPDPKSTSKDIVSGRVRWRFRMRWSAGGEESVWQDRTDALKHPWWSPAHEPPAAGPSSAVIRRPILELEDGFPTTPRYRNLRKQNHEYKYRHDPLQDLYDNLFPAHLLMPFTALLPDANFPRGWICRKCGRMNFQRSLRRRKCPSALCKDLKPISYFLDLFLLRDPQDRLNLPLPYNTYPDDGVKVRHTRWDDGTQTFSCLMPDANKMTSCIKHVFTGNLPDLQSYTEEWLKYIQLELDIVRKPGHNGPYFGYSANFRRSRKRADPNTPKWPKVPDCIIDVRDSMVSRAMSYAQVEGKNLRIDQLDILAWVTSGSKKYAVPIKATKKAAILLCLGCNITLNVTPLAKKTSPISEADDKEENPQDHAGWITGEFGDDPMEELTTSSSPKKQTATLKRDRSSFTLCLVHGDILVFFGDEFEFSIKRHGTSFLLMGSSVDSEGDECPCGDGDDSCVCMTL